MIKTAGIYKIICNSNGKFYIGSSVDINNRLIDHVSRLKYNKHKNEYLQNCWNKYGEQNFKFEIIETIHNIKDLPAREKWWIDSTECSRKEIGFNISNRYSSHIGTNFINLIGQQFGKLKVMGREENDKWGRSRFLCKCDCSNSKIISGNSLRSKNTKSCGCLVLKHGNNKNGNPSKTYKIWQHIRERCNNKNDISYKDYGDRKITVCDGWDPKKGGSFKNFLEDMGKCPSEQHSIDRINNNLGYYKENCRWATSKEQGRNKRNNRLIPYDGKKLCVPEWSEITGVPENTIRMRIEAGWSPKKTLTTPTRKYKRAK